LLPPNRFANSELLLSRPIWRSIVGATTRPTIAQL
jgi:hypothetical protein